MEKKFDINKLAGTAGTVINGIQAVKSLFGNQRKEERHQDARQIKMQGELNKLNAEATKDLANYEQDLKMKMWKDTNYSAQLNEATKAGLSKVAVLGGSGGGTQGASVGSGGIGSGASGSAQQHMVEIQNELAKAQTANLMAQTGKTVAETKKISGADTGKVTEETRATKFANDINELYKEEIGRAKGWQAGKEIISGEQANYEWEALKTAIKGSMEDENNPMVKAKKAELETKMATLDNLIQDNKNKIKDGTLKDDEHAMNKIRQEIEGFTADLTDLGINGTTTSVILKMLGALGGIRVKEGVKIKGGKK